jgi:hypothetical protein
MNAGKKKFLVLCESRCWTALVMLALALEAWSGDPLFGATFHGIFGVKFYDRNENGVQEPGEPGIEGWTIRLYTEDGQLVATTVTDPSGQYRFSVPRPGLYFVSEAPRPGWVQVYPKGSGVHSIELRQGEQADPGGADFGNVQVEPNRCLTLSFSAGTFDEFSLADGATREETTPPPGKPKGYFDDPAPAKTLWQRFTLPGGNRVYSAFLVVRTKPVSDRSADDRIFLYSGRGSSMATLGLRESARSPHLLPKRWDRKNYPGGETITLNLGNLSNGVNLLPELDRSRWLDVGIGEDSCVDAMHLAVTFSTR